MTVAGLAGMLALSACTGGGDDARVTPEPSAPAETANVEATPTPTSTPTALTEEDVLAALPEAALRDDFSGAVAFSEFFLVESQEIGEDFDTRVFEYLSDSECSFCAYRIEATRDGERRGLRSEGGELTVDLASQYGGIQDDDTWYIELDVVVEAETFHDSAGEVVGEAEMLDTTAVVLLARDDTLWRVLEVDTK